LGILVTEARAHSDASITAQSGNVVGSRRRASTAAAAAGAGGSAPTAPPTRTQTSAPPTLQTSGSLPVAAGDASTEYVFPDDPRWRPIRCVATIGAVRVSCLSSMQ
jgi:hypothetical protein